MKTHLLAAAALALSAAVASPAAAQVSGIAIAQPAVAVASSTALQNAYNQIATTFQAQRTQIEQLEQQRQGLVRQFDTDGDGQLSEAESTAARSNTAALTQIQGVEQQLATAQAPVTQARMYALEQVAAQFNDAIQQVIAEKSLQLILAPDSAVYYGDAVEVTDEIAAALNTRVPTVSTTVPAGWQPTRQTANLYQEVQQILLQAMMAQQAAQQPAAAQQQPPVGR